MNSYVVDSPLTHVRHVPGSVPGLCSVCKYLQGQARDNLQQSVTPAQPQAVQGRSHRGRSWRHRGLC